MPDPSVTSTGATDEVAFAVVAPSRQQIHFHEKEARNIAREKAWRETADAVEKERARRRHEKEQKAANEERIKRAWNRTRAAVAAKRTKAERIRRARDKEQARVAARRAKIPPQQVVEDEERTAKVKNEGTAPSVELDALWSASKGETSLDELLG